MTPYKMQNLVYEWVDFSKFTQIEPKNFFLNLEKVGNFAQNLTQTWADSYMNGSLFIEILVFV